MLQTLSPVLAEHADKIKVAPNQEGGIWYVALCLGFSVCVCVCVYVCACVRLLQIKKAAFGMLPCV